MNSSGQAAVVIDMATVGIGASIRRIQQEQVKKMVRAQLDSLHVVNEVLRERR
jgi:hypothetical protein